ncbi:MAG: hypothetical protein FWG44_02600 [Oscillospiraceae bacterium]|nr:hypothetical protein [Oscillospiraceae bacterium]
MIKAKKYTAILIILVMAVSLFTACGSDILGGIIGGEKGNYKITAGGWDGDTFTSEWSNITFTVPESMRKFTNREMLDITLWLEGAISNHDQSAGVERDLSKWGAFVDFAVIEKEAEESYVIVYYVGANKNETAQDFINELETENINYVITEFGVTPVKTPRSTMRIAGETFQKGGYYIEFTDSEYDDDFTLYTDYLVRKQGDLFIVFVVEYDDIDEDIIMQFLNSIKTAG